MDKKKSDDMLHDDWGGEFEDLESTEPMSSCEQEHVIGGKGKDTAYGQQVKAANQAGLAKPAKPAKPEKIKEPKGPKGPKLGRDPN